MAVILIVEDDATLRQSYRMILELTSHTIYEAVDGQDGIDTIQDISPDIILLDMHMPKLDGIGFLEHADVKNMNPKPKVIVFSNLEEGEQLKAAYKLGADRYVLKAGTSPKELIALIETVLKTT